MLKRRYRAMLAALVLASGAGMWSFAADNSGAKAQTEKFIAVLKSDAPAAEKAITCKRLAVFGGADAVPALAPLLVNPELSSWARIALEAIPDASADAALRDAAGKAQGRTLTGVLNSIGVRRDKQAVGILAEKMKDSDAEVASCAAAALGKVGGYEATEALQKALAAGGAAPVRSAIGEGLVLCAEQFLADNNRDEAVKLYDLVRNSDMPKQRVLEGTRGAIIARGPAGLPLLVEQLRAEDKAMFNLGLGVAREVSGAEVTQALLAEFAKASPSRQALLLLAMGDRGDKAALPTVLQAARSGSSRVRIAAVRVLERLGDASCAPVLLEAAAGDDAELAQVARVAISRLPGGQQVDALILSQLEASSGRMRQVLVELAEQRRIEGALPLFVKIAQDQDPAVRTAAVVAVGAIGEAPQVPGLVQLYQGAKDANERASLERAIMSICGRWGSQSVEHLMPLVKSNDATARMAGLHAMATCGGPAAVAAVKSGVEDSDEAVRDEAVRTLATWPNRWPDDASVAEPLLALAKSGQKIQHKVLGLRGYLQYVQGAKKLSGDEKMEKVQAVLPLVTRPEEKRLAISVLNGIGSAGALEPLVGYAADPAVVDEACAAIVNVVGRTAHGLTAEQRDAALKLVVEKTKNAGTKRRAQELLNRGR